MPGIKTTMKQIKIPVRQTAQHENIEILLQELGRRIEDLKVQFNLYFSGELKLPPEKDREELEKRIRNLIGSSHRSPRVNLLIQNVSSRFSVYNNMWLKKLNELETGVSVIQKKKVAFKEEIKKKQPPKGTVVDVSLNSEDSFDRFFDSYAKMTAKGTAEGLDKEKIINSIKSRLITANFVDAKINLSVEEGKLKIKIKNSV